MQVNQDLCQGRQWVQSGLSSFWDAAPHMAVAVAGPDLWTHA